MTSQSKKNGLDISDCACDGIDAHSLLMQAVLVRTVKVLAVLTKLSWLQREPPVVDRVAYARRRVSLRVSKA